MAVMYDPKMECLWFSDFDRPVDADFRGKPLEHLCGVDAKFEDRMSVMPDRCVDARRVAEAGCETEVRPFERMLRDVVREGRSLVQVPWGTTSTPRCEMRDVRHARDGVAGRWPRCYDVSRCGHRCRTSR